MVVVVVLVVVVVVGIVMTILHLRGRGPCTTWAGGLQCARPRGATGDHWRQREGTGDDERQRETMGGNGRARAATGGIGRAREATGGNARAKALAAKEGWGYVCVVVVVQGGGEGRGGRGRGGWGGGGGRLFGGGGACIFKIGPAGRIQLECDASSPRPWRAPRLQYNLITLITSGSGDATREALAQTEAKPQASIT